MSDKPGDHLSRDVHFTLKDPHGWIQFKGTEICIDIRCKCGELSHYDGGFMYFIKCPHCGQVYEANGHIQLIPVEHPGEDRAGVVQEAE